MNCCQCEGIEAVFDEKMAARELKNYRKKGPSKATRILIDALKTQGVEGLTLLDIGAGVGAVHHELLKAGVARATDVDASGDYLAAARQEAIQQGHAEQVSYRHGNFVELAPEIGEADIVTLDRVICCFDDMPSLVGLSAQRARKLYGAIYPRDRWWVKAGLKVENFIMWLSRNPFRAFVHPTEAVNAELRRYGLEQRFYRSVGPVWQVVVYNRPGAP